MSNLKISQMTSLQKKIQHFFHHSLTKAFVLKYFPENLHLLIFHLKIYEKRKQFVF